MREKTSQWYMQGYEDFKSNKPKAKGFNSGMARRLYNDGYADAMRGLAPRR